MDDRVVEEELCIRIRVVFGSVPGGGDGKSFSQTLSFQEIQKAFILGPGNKDVDIIIPRDKPFVAHRPEKGAVGEVIGY